jgi:DNA-binding NtrC family response regulator
MNQVSENTSAIKIVDWLVGKSLEEIEYHAITATLASCNGSKAKAAQLLGVSAKTIYNKLKVYEEQRMLPTPLQI